MCLLWIAVNTRGAATCSTWSEDEFTHLFDPVHTIVRLIEELDAESSASTSAFATTCAALLGDNNFAAIAELLEDWEEGLGELGDELDDETRHSDAPDASLCDFTSSVRAPLPATCTVAAMTGAGECAVKIPLDRILGTPDLDLQMAFGSCPGSILPFMSFRVGGAGATKLLAPCSSDSQCGPNQACVDLAAIGSDAGFWTDMAIETIQSFMPEGKYSPSYPHNPHLVLTSSSAHPHKPQLILTQSSLNPHSILSSSSLNPHPILSSSSLNPHPILVVTGYDFDAT